MPSVVSTVRPARTNTNSPAASAKESAFSPRFSSSIARKKRRITIGAYPDRGEGANAGPGRPRKGTKYGAPARLAANRRGRGRTMNPSLRCRRARGSARRGGALAELSKPLLVPPADTAAPPSLVKQGEQRAPQGRPIEVTHDVALITQRYDRGLLA